MTDSSLELDSAAAALLFRDARTPNAYTDEPVTTEQLHAVYDLVKWGPTSMNQQSLRVVEVPKGEKRDQLVEAMMKGNKEKTADAPMVLVFAADLDFHANLATQFPSNPQAAAWFDGMGRGGREASAKLNASIAIGYWIMGIRAAGLSVGPMTGANFTKIDEMLFDDGRHAALVVATVGHADPSAHYPRGPRLDVHEVITQA